MSYEALFTHPVISNQVEDEAPPRWGVSSLIPVPRCFLLMAVLSLLVLISPPVSAHKVNMFAYVEGGKVMMEGYFADGNKPVNCEVVVTDPNKKVLVKGRTDDEGKYSFDIPEITDLKIALNAGMGHRAEYVISRSELTGVIPIAASAATSQEDNQTSSTAVTNDLSEDSPIPSTFSESSLRKAVTEANVPLLRSIEELKEGAKFGNIIGGIGFIFGIVGVLFYIKARKMLGKSGSQHPAGK